MVQTEPLSLPDQVLQFLSNDPRVRVPIADIAESLVIPEDEAIETCAELSAEGLTYLATMKDSDTLAVVMDEDVASAFGYRLDRSGEWWTARDQEQRSTDSHVISETDGPTRLDHMPDPKADDPALMAEINDHPAIERAKGKRVPDSLVHEPFWPFPIIMLVGCQAWPPDPRKDGKCPVCHGKPLKTRTICLWCDRWSNDGTFDAYHKALALQKKRDEAKKPKRSVKFKPKGLAGGRGMRERIKGRGK